MVWLGVPAMPSPLVPPLPAPEERTTSVFAPVPPPRWMPTPPRKPRPSTLDVPLRVRVDVVSSARTPPTEPFHAAAVRPELVVAVVYCGTRTTWNVRCPAVAVAAAVA